jgi:predicted site-specific integrase-resolvase
MSNEQDEKQIVSYERLSEDDRTSADLQRQLDQYVWANLPLTDAQKRELRGMLQRDEVKEATESKEKSE